MVNYSIGVDIGGTTIATGLVNENGEVLHKVEVPSVSNSREGMFEQVVLSIETLHSSLKEAERKKIKGVGVGVPGKVDIEKGIAIFQNNLSWDNFPITDRLKKLYPNYPIEMDNDVYMATFAEHQMNQIRADETFVYLTISTGIACAIIDKNTFLRGNGFAGEVGFLPTLCLNGAIDRLEQIASGPAIAKQSRELTGQSGINTKAVFRDFSRGERYADTIIKNAACEIAQGLYAIICVVDPHQIVLGGSVILRNPPFLELIKEELKSIVIEEQSHILERLTISRLENNQGIIGAGLKAINSL